jgi:rhodanese-related sulfurtransferase
MDVALSLRAVSSRDEPTSGKSSVSNELRSPIADFRQTREMQTIVAQISRDQLCQKVERGDEFVLVDALAPISYAHSHLPGAINLPPEWVDERGPRRIPDLETEVVVYCASSTCDSSVIVASRLIELGYRNVSHYVEGKRGWVEAGLPLEGGGVEGRGRGNEGT